MRPSHVARADRRFTKALLVHFLALYCGLAGQNAPESLEKVSTAEAAAHLASRDVPQPVLPLKAIRNHVSGTVCLAVAIAPSGDVAAVQPISGHPLLVQPAIEAVKQWKYNSFIWGGQAHSVRTEVCVDFPPWQEFPRRVNRTSMALLALAIGCLGLCVWAWKATLTRGGQTVKGARSAVAIAALSGVSISTLIYVGSVIAWVAYFWTGDRTLVGHASTVLGLLSAAAIFGSAALQPRNVRIIVAMASALMFCLWLLVGITSVAV